MPRISVFTALASRLVLHSSRLVTLALRRSGPLRGPLVALVIAVATFPGLATAQADLTIPAPRGLLSDFASVVPADHARLIEALAGFVRERSGGEIAIVTLPDLGGRDVGEVALRIGREWRVGANAAIGDARRNAGVVVLLVPKETSADGQGYISIQVGQGAEGFIPDGVAGQIRREATDRFRQRDYGGGLAVITFRLAERYASEFGFSLDSAGIDGLPRASRSARPRGIPVSAALLFVVVLIIVLTGGGRRGGILPFLVGHAIGHSVGRRGGWGGHGGFGGGFGGGGGGFGGFGGGGGFSGGGSSGSF